MSESQTPEVDTPYAKERLAEIARMADLLTNRLLNDQIMGRAVSKEGIRALLGASSLLKDYGHAIPPLLGQIVQDFGDVEDFEPPKSFDEDGREEAERLAWSLRPFREPSGRES